MTLDLGWCQGYMGLKYHMEEALLERNENHDKAVWNPPLAIFSNKYYNEINVLNHTKMHDYCFIGSIKSCFERRKWVIDFAKKNFTSKSVFINTDVTIDNKNKYELIGDYDQSYKSLGVCIRDCANNQSKNVQYRIVRDNIFYFQTMCQSEFVLCPAGDSSWSFRFYETLMCKSIPIVESWHHTYRTIEESKIKYEYMLCNNMDQLNNVVYNNLIDKNTLLFNDHHFI